MTVLSHPPPASFDLKEKRENVWLGKEYTLPATFSFDAVLGDPHDQVIPVFSQTKAGWGSPGCDALTYFLSVDRNDYSFRFNGFDLKHSPTQYRRLLAVPGKSYHLKCTITATSASYSIDDQDYATVTYPIGSVPQKGYFGFFGYYATGATVKNLVTFGLASSQDIKEAFQNEWPNAQIANQVYADRSYAGLPTKDAVDIWNQTGLGRYTWTEESFDCDDFSYVYKGAVSKHVYGMPVKVPVAVGIVFGRKPGAAHAVNIFLDELGRVRILEPQNGSVVDGKDWDYTPYFVLM
jgi:hypothetical protein